MNLKDLSLPFPETDIEWRIGQCGKKGNGQIWAMCLAYVQARAIMNRLDEVVGPGGWQVRYRFEPGSDKVDPGVLGIVGIKVGEEWVEKEDGAEQTDIESFKGGLSSALKRAGSAWGIGRYLYNLEASFAQIVPQGTKGAQWGKTKSGDEFYWLPPALPQWALPKGHDAAPRGVHPEQPGPRDGVNTGVDEWAFSFGKFNRYTLEQVYNEPKWGPAALASYADWLLDSAKKKGTDLTPSAREAVLRIEQFLGATENGARETKDDLPY
jgi:hypothetical protein